MILCLCRGVSDRAVRAVIDAGAATVDDVTAACAAGSDCGACHEMLEEVLGQITRRRHSIEPATA